MENVLILGGTGAMGSYLVKELSDKFHVVVTSRKSHPSSGNISYVVGNAHDLEFLKCLLAKSQYAAIIDFMNYGTAEYTQKYMLFLKSTDHYFYLSSARVYANSSEPITEESPRLLDVSEDKVFLNTDDYALAKARQENLIRQSGYQNWTIIRPYMSYFPNRLDLGHFSKEQWLYRVLHNRSIVFPLDVAQSITTLTHGKDVAKSIAALIGNKDAKSNTFHITCDYNYTWSEVIEVYKKEIESKGYKMNVKYIPEDLLPSEYIYKYDRVFNRVFDNKKIRSIVGPESFIDPKEGLTNCIVEFLNNPRFNNIDWKLQAMFDREVGEYTPLSEIPTKKNRLIYLLLRYFVRLQNAKSIKQILLRK